MSNNKKMSGAAQTGDSEGRREALGRLGPPADDRHGMTSLTIAAARVLDEAADPGDVTTPHGFADRRGPARKGAAPMNFDQIFVAAATGDSDALRLALAGCNPRARNEQCRTPLMVAAANGNADCLRILLPVSDPLAKDVGGLTAFMLAASYGRIECLSILLPVSDHLAVDNKCRTALIFAAGNGHYDCASLIKTFTLASAEAAAIQESTGSTVHACCKRGPRV